MIRSDAPDWVRDLLLGGDPSAPQILGESEQRIAFELGTLASLLAEMGGRRVLLVIDEPAVTAAQMAATLEAQLAALKAWEVFTAFQPNPRSDDAHAAAQRAAALTADAVVAIGGGSCLDTAKIAALAGPTPQYAAALSRGEALEHAAPLPLIAVPTTSGTGSDATHFAAIYVQGRKVSVAHPKLRPAAVILDPAFHQAMPAALAACSGLDALCQVMESMWAVSATPRSLAYARAAGRLIVQHLVPSVRQANPAARRAVMVGAHLAGQAINLSKTTAAHALSYPLTQGFGLPHGHAVALNLGQLAKLNANVQPHDCLDPRGPEHVRQRVNEAASLLATTPDRLPDTLANLLNTLGLAPNLRDAGVNENACHTLAAQVDPLRLSNNPRRLNPEQLAALLTAGFHPHAHPS